MSTQPVQGRFDDTPTLARADVATHGQSGTTSMATPQTTNQRTSPSSADGATCEQMGDSKSSDSSRLITNPGLWLPAGVKPYYQDEAVLIIHADCRDILPLILSESVDLVLTDPPYGIGHPTDYASRGRDNLAASTDYPPVHGDDGGFDTAPWLALGVPLVLWGANHFADRLPSSSGWLVWDKERPDELDQSTCELAWTNCVKGVRRFRWLWHGMMRASREPLVHPTQKAEALMRWCLQLVPHASLILDPFMGSGTTLRAAKDLGRYAIGIEIEEKYCEIAAKRMAQMVMPLG